jgi:hypothetical protein
MKRDVWKLTIIACVLMLGGLGSDVVQAQKVGVEEKRAALIGAVDEVNLSPDGTYDLEAFGFHSAPVAPEKPDGVFRVLNIGDSFAYAITRKEFTYSAVIENEINGASGTKRIEVVNLGVPSVGFPEYIALYRFWSSRLEHDAVIFNVFAGNDFIDTRYSLPYRLLGDDIGGMDDLFFSFKTLNKLQSGGSSTSTFKPAPAPDPRYEAQNQFSDESYVGVMRLVVESYLPEKLTELGEGYRWAGRFLAVADEIAASGKDVLVSIAPSHLAHALEWRSRVAESMDIPVESIDPLLPGAMIGWRAKRDGHRYAFEDLTRCMDLYEQSSVDTFYGTNTHWSVEGNAAAGQAFADWIAKHWLDMADFVPVSKCTPEVLKAADDISYEALALDAWRQR